MLDIGQDGTGLEANARFARDAAALMLQYYNGDYTPVAGSGNFNLFSADVVGLYNGNIAALSTATYSVTPLLKLFRYDKLNRIKQMQTAGVSAGEWGNLTDNFSTEYRYDYNGNILSLQRKDATAQIMHRINYTYNAKNNRLQSITATGINSSFYDYDAIGNLSNDSGENIQVSWNAMNKVKQVNLPNNRQLQFSYSPTGQRQIKKMTDKTEYYLHDATGNIMCIYELSGKYLTVKERTIYGSKRIGVYRQRIRFGYSGIVGGVVIAPGSDLINILNPRPIISPDGRHYLEGSNRLQVIGVNRAIAQTSTISYAYKKGTPELKGLSPSIAVRPTFLDGTKTAGLRDYELTDHLSNVMAVISDRKLSVDTNSDTITDYYAPQVVSFTDYYPGGFPQPGRSFNLGSYRYGHNGHESDAEISGSWGSHYTADYWMMDSRILRRWEPDPVVKPHESPYAVFANNPIWFVDINGLDTVEVFKKSGKINNHIETDKGDDVFFFVSKDKSGKIVRGEQKTFKEGTILDIRKGEGEGGADIYKLRGDESSQELFEWYANNIKVEFSLFKTGEKGESGLNFITTSHEKSTERGGRWLFDTQLKYGYTIREHIHNHPGNTPNPSGQTPIMKNGVWLMPGEWGDLGVAAYFEKNKQGLGTTVFRIYTAKDGKYHKYDKNTGILPAVTITAKKKP